MSVTEFSADAWQASSPELARGLETRAAKLQALVGGLEALADSGSISGEGADGMRAYIRGVHVPIANALLSAIRTLQTAVGVYWSGYAQVDGAGNFWLVRDELEDHRSRLTGAMESVRGFGRDLRAITTGVPGYETVGASAAGRADAVVAGFESLQRVAKEQLETWEAYEATDPGFVQVQEVLAKLSSIMTSAGTLAVGRGREYAWAGFHASFGGLQDLLTPMEDYCRTHQALAAEGWEGLHAQYREDHARKPWWGREWDSVAGTSVQMVSILGAFAFGAKDRSVTYGAESSFTQVIREHETTEEFRGEVRAYLRDGKSLDNLESGGYKAGPPRRTNGNLWRDAQTLLGRPGGPLHPLVPGENRVLVTLGTYDVTAETVAQTGPNSAVVRFTAYNETTLGSMLRDGNDAHYQALNEWAGSSGPMSKYVERFVWEETLTW